MSTITFPAPDLSAQIDFCWSVTGDAAGGAAFHEAPPGQRRAPRRPALVVRRADGPPRSRHREGFRRARPRLPVLRHPLPHRAGSASRGCPRFGLTNGYVELSRLAGRAVDSVADQLRSLPDAASRQRLIGSVEARSPAAGGRSPVQGRRAAPRDARRKPQRRRARPRAGSPRRSLERTFRNELGVTPKRLIRLVRPARARRAARRPVRHARRARARGRLLGPAAHDQGLQAADGPRSRREGRVSSAPARGRGTRIVHGRR